MLYATNYKQLTKIFMAYVIPSIGSQLLSGVYTIVDGYFIGKGIGEGGIAAVGLAFPFTLFVMALGTGVGVGGGALISISIGRGRRCLAERILGIMILLLAVLSFVTMTAGTILSEYLLSLYSVSETQVAEMARTYVRILLIGSPTQLVAMGMLGAVRNDGFPRKAMWVMVCGCLLNIILDWLFVIVFPFGVAGAAFATVTAQLFTAVCLVSHFLLRRSSVAQRRRLPRFSGKMARGILSMGLPAFGVQVAAAVTMLVHNWQSLAYGGDMGVAAYSVVSYAVPVGIMLQEGIAEGIQPIVSYCHGASLYARRSITARMGLVAALAVGLSCSLLAIAASGFIPRFFSLTGETAALASRGILFSAAMFPFLGIAKVGASYFQSIGKLKQASLLTYGDPMALIPFFVWILPIFWGLDGVWLTTTFANVVLSGVFVVMWRIETGKKITFPAMRRLL